MARGLRERRSRDPRSPPGPSPNPRDPPRRKRRSSCGRRTRSDCRGGPRTAADSGAKRGLPSSCGGRAAPAAKPDQVLLGAVAAAMALVKAHRMHGHLAAHLDPLGSEPVGDPALEPERLIPKLTPELQAQVPASVLRVGVEGETLADVLPKLARSTAARSPTRSSTSPITRSASGSGRRSSRAATGSRSSRTSAAGSWGG